MTAGIQALRSSSGLLSITNRGDITVTTGSATQDSDFVGAAAAIVANATGGGSIVVDNDPDLAGTGQDTGGMTLFVNNGTSTTPGMITVANAGTISTNGRDVFGIIAQARGAGAQLSVTNAAAITLADASNSSGLFLLDESASGRTTVNNTGAITANGAGFARGVGVSSFGAPTTGSYVLDVTNSGNVTLNTPFAQAFTNFSTRDGTATLTFRNTGTIDLRNTTNAASRGIGAIFDLAQAGIATQGTSTVNIVDDGAIGLGAGVAILANATSVNIDNSGDLSTSGANSDVVSITGLDTGTTGGTVVFATGGDLVATGAGSAGLQVTNSGGNTITIAAATRVASGTGTAAAALRLATGTVSTNVTNAGTIESAAGTGLLLTTGTRMNLTNTGTVSGGANAIDTSGSGSATGVGMAITNANGGRINGNVSLGASEDVFEGQAGSLLTGNLTTPTPSACRRVRSRARSGSATAATR